MSEHTEQQVAAEAKLSTLNAEIEAAEKRLAVVEDRLKATQITSAELTALRAKVNGYGRRVIRFDDLKAVEDVLADFEKRIAKLEKSK